jgi:hypothetical protein
MDVKKKSNRRREYQVGTLHKVGLPCPQGFWEKSSLMGLRIKFICHKINAFTKYEKAHLYFVINQSITAIQFKLFNAA